MLVRVEALLERRSGEASVVLLGVLRTDSGPVNNQLEQAFSVHWAVHFHSTVALRRTARVVWRGGLAVNYSAVVLSDDSCHIWHATITNLQRVGVEDLVQLGYQTNDGKLVCSPISRLLSDILQVFSSSEPSAWIEAFGKCLSTRERNYWPMFRRCNVLDEWWVKPNSLS